MMYPGRVIKRGETEARIVNAIAQQLEQLGYMPSRASTGFDSALMSLVKTFQAQNVDAAGRPLRVDGEIGPLTWGALFGATESSANATGIAAKALAKALTQLHVREHPPRSNRGTEVDAYLKSVGLPPGHFWCMAFVHWCFEEAAAAQSIANPFPRTGGCLKAWNEVKAKTPARIITKAQAVADPSLVRPGLVFILDYGRGMGHTGFVRHFIGGALQTVEGNANLGGSRDGGGVHELNRRNVMDRGLRGFLNFN